MKLDHIIDNVYFKDAIYLNTDKLDEKDMRNFIEFIKKETDLDIQNKIYVHELFSLKNSHFIGRNNSIIDKFKIILSDDSNIKIAFMDENFQGKIHDVSYKDILDMKLEEVDDPVNYYYEAYRLTIYMKDNSILTLDTSTSVSQIRKDMDKFLINLKENFDNYNQQHKESN